jgi:GNAT superfamily N-acetyltransferase
MYRSQGSLRRLNAWRRSVRKAGITVRTSNRVPAKPVYDLFQRMCWQDWLSLDDVRWFLDHSLYVASAWADRQCVGIGVVVGDGRISAFLSTLVVDSRYQGRGIGTALMRKIVARVERLRPYYFGLDIFERRTRKFYERFGFVLSESSWLMQHEPTARRLRAMRPPTPIANGRRRRRHP